MGLVLVAVAVLGLLTGGQSAPVTDCDNLTQIIEIQGREQLLGRWTYLSDTSNEAGSQSLTKLSVGTTWVKYTAANESDTISVLQSQKIFGSCFGLRYTMTLENNTLSVEDPVSASMVLLSTGCHDCLVIASENTFGRGTYDSLMLLTRRNNVTAAEMEEFNKQAECLNLPSPVFLDSRKGFCTEESLFQKTENVTSTEDDSFQAD